MNDLKKSNEEKMMDKINSDEDNDNFQMLKPANSNETKSFSTSTKASDLLF